MASIALYGGTFDPPHLGHLTMAEAAFAQLRPQQLRLIPAAIPAHRAQPQASAAHRLAMVEIMAAQNKHFVADRRELDRITPSITIDSLRELHAQMPGQQWIFLLGEDSFSSLNTWDDWKQLCALCSFAVFPRRDSQAIAAEIIAHIGPARETALLANKSWCWINTQTLDISATAIRLHLAQSKPSAFLLADVASYIKSHNLYQGAQRN